MTDLFTRLAAQHRGTAPMLAPVLPGLFEPQNASQDGFVEETETNRTRTDLVASDRDGRPEPSRKQTQDLPEQHIPEPQNSKPPDVSPQPPPERETLVERHVHHDHHESHLERITERQQVTREFETRHHQETLRIEAEPAPVAPEPAAQEVSRAQESPKGPEPARRFEDAPPPGKVPLMRPPVVDMPPHAAPQGLPPKPPPERRVDVHIGHLEIRAAPPASQSRQKRRRPDNPAPDLNTYLGGRR